MAQRPMDVLDRGLVAVPGTGGYLVSWRIFGEEYYDTQYNLYRDGELIAKELSVSNYLDTGGKSTSAYTVVPVILGTEGEACEAVTPWVDGYFDIPIPAPLGRGGSEQWDYYSLNDVSLGDVDGDGKAEMVVKMPSSLAHDLSNDSLFHHLACVDWDGSLLWWIDLGPNMLAGADEQWDLVLYDWDGDGKAEALMRGADNMIIHTADGQAITIGDATVDTRWDGISYTNTGNEYLLYIEGATGQPYEIGPTEHPLYIDYPLARGDVSDWGDGYGHRATKHYFGAPFLDGRNASVFLGRGCYTKHAMTALDVDPATHQLSERWSWGCSDESSAWYGQGYHNFAIADVDMDGRDEIVFGSMVIDDTGNGLSTTGLGHGDAQHCGDLDPYRWGLEQFACNEDQPNMNYRNATTSQIYYRSVGTSDDGRALCGNFTNDYPGCVGRSINTGMVSTVADREITVLDGMVAWGNLNARIYWDGDLLDEVLNSPGTEREARIWTGSGSILFTSSGCNMNNSSKNNPCAQGDLVGDWREELVLRSGTSLRVYTTTHESDYGIYTLWHDHQYRNAMVWQSLGYNQPPHVSYFLGELEGITQAPPPLTLTNRTEVASGGTIGKSLNGQHVIVCETGDAQVSVEQGAAPWVATFNVASWVQGHDDNDGITCSYNTCTVTGGGFAGGARLVKQGEGTLVLPVVAQTHTGNTDVWGGTLSFSGSLPNSALWLNRFTALESDGGSFRSIRADYGASIRPGGAGQVGGLTADTLRLGFGSRVEIDLDPATLTCDSLSVGCLTLGTQAWSYGPEYDAPVFTFAFEGELGDGTYCLGHVGSLVGALDSVRLEGLPNTLCAALAWEDGVLSLKLATLREATSIVWEGAQDGVWDLGVTDNWTLASDTGSAGEVFATGDVATFTDAATTYSVSLKGELEADSVIVDAEGDYTFAGNGSLTGGTTLVKRGTGTLSITNDNSFTGGVRISGGTVRVETLASEYRVTGALGALTTEPGSLVMEGGGTLYLPYTAVLGAPLTMEGDEGGVLRTAAAVSLSEGVSGSKLTKSGTGTLTLQAECPELAVLEVAAGEVIVYGHDTPADSVVLRGGTLTMGSSGGDYPIYVPEDGDGTWSLGARDTYGNRLTGSGEITVYFPAGPSGAPRTPITGDWSDFTGIVHATTAGSPPYVTFDNSHGLPEATLDIADGQYVMNTSGRTFRIGKLTGDGGYLAGPVTFSQSSATGKVTWAIGGQRQNSV